jgi:hypothetical protein
MEGKNTPLLKEIAWNSGALGILDFLQQFKFLNSLCVLLK